MDGKVNLLLSDDHQILWLSGALNFKDVVRLRDLGKRFLAQETPVEMVIDLQGVKRSDNSGLVLLITWMRDARRLKKSVVYRDPPEFLLRMAEVFGLRTILFNR